MSQNDKKTFVSVYGLTDAQLLQLGLSDAVMLAARTSYWQDCTAVTIFYFPPDLEKRDELLEELNEFLRRGEGRHYRWGMVHV